MGVHLNWGPSGGHHLTRHYLGGDVCPPTIGKEFLAFIEMWANICSSWYCRWLIPVVIGVHPVAAMFNTVPVSPLRSNSVAG